MEIPGCDPNACDQSEDESGADEAWRACPNQAGVCRYRNRARAWCHLSCIIPRRKCCLQKSRFVGLVLGLNHAFPKSVDAFSTLSKFRRRLASPSAPAKLDGLNGTLFSQAFSVI